MSLSKKKIRDIKKDFNELTAADPKILKRVGALCRPSWLAGEKKFRFQMV